MLQETDYVVTIKLNSLWVYSLWLFIFVKNQLFISVCYFGINLGVFKNLKAAYSLKPQNTWDMIFNKPSHRIFHNFGNLRIYFLFANAK